MKKQIHVFLSLLSAAVIAVAGCNTESGETTSSIAPIVTGTGSLDHVDQNGGPGGFEYSHDLGSTPKDVYFVLTNTNSSDLSTVTTVGSSYGSVSGGPFPPERFLKESQDDIDLVEWARDHGVGLRGRPDVSAFNARAPGLNRAEQGDPLYRMVAEEPRYTTVGDTYTFMNESVSDTIAATARKVVSDGSVSLNIWVADDSWGSCGKHYCMNQTMVDAFADKFLQSGSDNDIFDWVSSIYGDPWGTHDFSNLIAATAGQEIDVLFFDIEDDGDAATDPDPTGGILGFFWSKDNFLTSAYSYSNQRLLFYMDAVLTAKAEDGSWEITDYWPAEMVSTLAHEFQHMIHFYQKNVTFNTSSETWINEMASMMAEDFLADKMAVNGPRGVSYSDSTAGSSGNTNGRLPMFNSYNYIGPTVWYSGTSSLINYAVNYAFGSYLARNYGGAELFRNIVQSQYTDYRAITSAVETMGYDETFASLLQKWGAAVLLSDQTDQSQGYRYNIGGAFTSTLSGIDYNLGSINLFNYEYNSLSGPYLFTPSTLSSLGRHYALSNTYVLVAEGETGLFSETVDMPSGILLTVVTRDSN